MSRKIINYLPAVFLLIVWFIFAYPYFLQDKAPFAATYQVNNFAPWSAYEEFWGPVKNGAMPDVITQIYPWRHLAIDIWKSGNVPLWNPYSFSGTPLLANYQSGALSPFNILFLVFPFVDGWSIVVLLQPLLAGIFMYLFVRSLKVSKVGCLMSSVSFMFCGFITVWMGYATLAYAILFLPLALFCIEKYYQTRRRIFLLVFSLTFPLSFFSGHFQISTYFFLFICGYIVYKFLSNRNIHNTLYIALFACFGLLITMPQVLPSVELYLNSFRSSFFQKGGILLEYIPTFLAPDFFGNPVTRNTWFGHYAEWNAYIGILPIMLAVYSILRIKKTQVFFLFTFAIFTLILATNNPISNFILSWKIPILSTSAIGRIIVLYSFAFGVLAGFGYDKLISDIKNARKKIIAVWISTFVVLFVGLWLIVAQKLFIPSDRIIVAKQNLILPTLLFAGSVIVIICGFVLRSHNRAKVFLPGVYLLLLVFVAFDMLRFATKWQAFDPKHLVFPDTPTTNAFSKISGFNRVFGNLGGEASIYYKLPSVEGYDALYIKRYGQFIGFIEKGDFIESAWSVVMFPKHSEDTRRAINLLGIKYIVHKLADNGVSWTFPFWTYPKDQFKLIYKDDKYEFYENTKAFPHAFLVGEYRVVKDQKQILKTIFSENFDLGNEIVLEQDPNVKKSDGAVGFVKVDRYEPSKISLTVDAKSQGLIFMPDNYSKGWKAKVDHTDAPIYRANYTFRAIPVLEGKHSVTVEYDPSSFRLGVLLAVFGLFGTFTAFLIPRFLTHLISILSLRSEKDK